MINLSEEQQIAVTKAIQSIETHQPQITIGGYAGTGKTTIIKSILKHFDKRCIAICAPTGKASVVLHKKGVPATTIHRLIYRYNQSEDKFYKLSKDDLKNIFAIIIDEASMIATDIYNDLLSYGKPLVFIGDRGQLEPVGDNPELLKNCDYTLNQIFRQAEDNPIIDFATKIRTRKPILSGPFSKNRTTDNLLSHDIILAGFNKTVKAVNNQIRAAKDIDHEHVVVGEKLIVLKNNYKYNLYNGQIITVLKLTDEDKYNYEAEVETDDGVKIAVKLNKYAIDGFKPSFKGRGVLYATYGYCITVHKSQGSEWDDVGVIRESWDKWDMRKWLYTAVTRASNKLTLY